MLNHCAGCSSERKRWATTPTEYHRALIVAGAVSNAQQRTLKFENDRFLAGRPENNCDITINVGSTALLSLIHDENRSMLALEPWEGQLDSATHSTALTNHRYNFTVLALGAKVFDEIKSRGLEKIYGIPTYVVNRGSIDFIEYDPDGSEVRFDIQRIS